MVNYINEFNLRFSINKLKESKSSYIYYSIMFVFLNSMFQLIGIESFSSILIALSLANFILRKNYVGFINIDLSTVEYILLILLK